MLYNNITCANNSSCYELFVFDYFLYCLFGTTSTVNKVIIMKKNYFLALALLSTSVAIAEKDEHREHDAHEHGHAQLSVIVEKNELLIMLETPALNVFGFEHKPENDKQHKTVDLAVKDLKNFAPLLTVDASAKCRLVKSEVKQPFDEEEHEHEESAHSDVDVEVAFSCENSTKLTTMDFTAFFKRFPLFEELEVQAIINGQQMAAELSKKKSILSLKK